MTTSPNTADLPGGLPAGVPDVEALARLANQFFQAVPGAARGGGADVGAPGTVLASAVPAPGAAR